MRWLLNILFWGGVGCLFYGFYHKTFVNFSQGEKWIGFSVLWLTFIYLPIFLVHRWKGKRLEDYTLTDENFAKMRERNSKKPENQ